MNNYLITYLTDENEKSVNVSASNYDDLITIINFENVVEENAIILSIEKK